MEFEEYWENYGELHASMCGGSIKQFAKEIWASAITKLKAQCEQKDAYIEMQQADVSELSNEVQRLREMIVDLERDSAVLIERYRKALEGVTCLCAEGVEFSSAIEIVQACYKEAMEALKGGE